MIVTLNDQERLGTNSGKRSRYKFTVRFWHVHVHASKTKESLQLFFRFFNVDVNVIIQTFQTVYLVQN